MAERFSTIAITCGGDSLAREVVNENMAAGRRAGHYQAFCGYRVVVAARAAPVG